MHVGHGLTDIELGQALTQLLELALDLGLAVEGAAGVSWRGQGWGRLRLALVLLVEVEGEADVLAVFQLEPSVKLLDVMDVKTDRFTGFLEDRPLFRLDSRSDAFIIYSTHWNAGESYLSVEMLFVDAGRFKSITSLFIYETKGCGVNFTEKPDFRAVADPGRKYPKVLVRVRLRKEADEEGCEHLSRGFTRYYRGFYRWNASKGEYASSSRQLDQLEKFNTKRLY